MSENMNKDKNLVILYKQIINIFLNVIENIQTENLNKIQDILLAPKPEHYLTRIEREVSNIDKELYTLRELFTGSQEEIFEKIDIIERKLFLKNESKRGRDILVKTIGDFDIDNISDAQDELLMTYIYSNKLSKEEKIALTDALQEVTNKKITQKKKNYVRYNIEGFHPYFEKTNISKRQLPTIVFEYLISNGLLEEKDFIEFSTNQFGRTFESKKGDLLTADMMKGNEKNLHRYNKIDFSKNKTSKYNGILYVSNQWDLNSITKFIQHINKKYCDKLIILTNSQINKE